MHKLNQIIKPFDSKLKKKLSDQNKFKLTEGCFVYELEADCTIPAEYIMLMHFLGEIDLKLEKKISKYLLESQSNDGGWPLFYDGESNISASVKAYYALKLSGISPSATRMKKAKEFIQKNGGAESVNVFTKVSLALFNQISWKAIPYMPIEIIKFPKWFPFNIYKISYWSRTVLIPLLIIMHKKPIANNPNGVSIDELFLDQDRRPNNVKEIEDKKIISYIFLLIDKISRKLFPIIFSKNYKQICVEKSYKWIIERLNGEDGLGGIFPAMVNSLIAMKIDKKSRFDRDILIAKKAINNLVVEKRDSAYCQPCVSPVWDTGWMGHVLMESNKNVDDLVDWFLRKEIKLKGDWCVGKKKISPGGWAFQFNNDFYPDVDDTALVGMFLDRYNRTKQNKKVEDCLERTRKWIISMQSKNGGWGAFDVNNDHSYLNSIPFADHGALLDPPTADVSARCISFLKQQNDSRNNDSIKKGLNYLISEQEKDGSWFGRWGTNYIYGTWSVLCALNLIEFPEKKEVLKKSTEYIKSMQRNDGGWGEDGKSYFKGHENYVKESTPSQTAWAIMGLISGGELDSREVEKGTQYLLQNNLEWEEKYYTAVGFPKVFYLKYHGYSKYFPLLAISKIKNLLNKNSSNPSYGV